MRRAYRRDDAHDRQHASGGGSPANKHGPGHDHHDDDHHEGLEPKLTIEELTKHRTFLFAGPDGREYQSELPGSWTNAKVAAQAVEKVCQECRDSPHFDTEGYGNNRELGRRIQKAFTDLKAGKGFVMAWRLYPDKDHPRWQPPTPKPAKRATGKKAKKPNGR